MKEVWEVKSLRLEDKRILRGWVEGEVTKDMQLAISVVEPWLKPCGPKINPF